MKWFNNIRSVSEVVLVRQRASPEIKVRSFPASGWDRRLIATVPLDQQKIKVPLMIALPGASRFAGWLGKKEKCGIRMRVRSEMRISISSSYCLCLSVRLLIDGSTMSDLFFRRDNGLHNRMALCQPSAMII